VDILQTIRTRRSIRRYAHRPVSDALLADLLEAAHWAPSGGNRQPWQFVIVTQPELCSLIRSVSPGAQFWAPLYIVICFVPAQGYKHTPGELEDVALADCYLPAQNIALAAHALGIGSCMIRSFAQAALRECLNIPHPVVPVLLLALGYPAEVPQAPRRRELDELVFAERYGRIWRPEGGNLIAQQQTEPQPIAAEVVAPAKQVSLGVEEALGLLVFLVMSARGLMDEPKEYGPRRLLRAAQRVAQATIGIAEAQTRIALTELDVLIESLFPLPEHEQQLVEVLDQCCIAVTGWFARIRARQSSQ